jgi:hypothetical protein
MRVTTLNHLKDIKSHPSPNTREPVANNHFSKPTLILLIILTAFGIYTFKLTRDLFPGGDNAHYLILAEALASGQGCRTISVVDEPYATQRPPGFPVLLIPVVYGFGMNVIIAKIFVAICGILSIVLVHTYFRHMASAQTVLIVTALYATAPVTLMYARRVYSTMPFVVLTFASLMAADALIRGKKIAIIAPLTALTCVAAFYVRTIGLALCLAVIVKLLFQKRWTMAVFMALMIFPLVAVWFYWTSKVEGVVASGYLSQFFREGSVIEILRLMFSNVLGYSRLLAENLWYLIIKAPDQLGLHWKLLTYLEIIVTMCTLGLILIGFFSQGKHKLGLAELYLGFYAGVLLIWPHTIDRFIIPILPFLVTYCWYGISIVWKAMSQKLNLRKLTWIPYSIVGIILLSNTAHLAARLYQEQHFDVFSPKMAAFYDVATWSKDNLPASAVVFTEESNFFYIYASRKTVDASSTLQMPPDADYIVLNHPPSSAFESGLPAPLYCSDIENVCIYMLPKGGSDTRMIVIVR